MSTAETEARYRALQLAIAPHHNAVSPINVSERFQLYFDLLMDNTAPPEDDQEDFEFDDDPGAFLRDIEALMPPPPTEEPDQSPAN